MDPHPEVRANMTQTPPDRKRRAIRVVLLALVILAGLLGGTAWRLTRAPIALPDWAVARAEARISRSLAPRALDLGEVALAYDMQAHALRFRLRDAALVEPDGAATVAVPDAHMSLDAGALVRGKLRPRRISVEGLAIDVTRDADGRFSLAFGSGGGALPGTWAEALETLDAALATPAIAELSEVVVDGVVIRFRDAVTGLSQTVQDGQLAWRREGDVVRLSLTSGLRLGGQVARGAVTLTRRLNAAGSGQGADARVVVTDLSLPGLSAALPAVPALTLVRGDVSASATMSVAPDGTPGPLRGRVEGRGLVATDRPRMTLDRAVLAFDWLPGSGRIGLGEIAASSDEVSLRAEGQILLEDGLTGPVQAQLRLGPTTLDPEGVFDRRVAFEQGVFEARLTQRPLALNVGQAMLAGPSGTARASGRLAFVPEGVDGSLTLTVPEMSVADLTALWPPELLAQSRGWFTNNLLGGRALNATGLIRLRPGTPPEAAASFDFTGGSFRYMRFMPPARDVTGAAQLSGARLVLRVDEGTVPAIGPDGAPDAAEAPGLVDIAGTTFTIPDTAARPATGEIDLHARGRIGEILTLLDNRPFRLLERLNKTRDLATGRAEARVTANLPLRRGNAPADIVYDVAATLRDVESRRLIPGRVLAAPRLSLSVDATAVQIAGDATLEGVPFSGRWRQPLPPPSTEAIDPDAPPAPPVPLPTPGRVEGTARVGPDGLRRLGLALEALTLAGETTAKVEIVLPPGRPPRLSVESDLRGMAVGLPAISWTKPRDRSATFAVAATLGDVPDVTAIRLDAPGLTAAGRIALRAGGILDAARFDRVDTGWFRGPLTLTGRGRGAAPAITIGGGQADLRRALLSSGGGDGGEGSPLNIALARLTISEGIALTDLRARLRNGAGDFTARLNGGAPIEGVVVPDGRGSAVQVRGADAGGVLRSAGLFRDARGGSITLTLRPTDRTGNYAGAVRMGDVRVRNAPALASLLQALSVVGILEQLTGEGLFFTSVETDFTLRPNDIVIRRASAVGPSMSITADGTYDLTRKRMDLQGVISPIYLVNGLFGALFARRDEGLFGFTYRLTGSAADPSVAVNPLSILTPGIFREIFRRPPPS
ncbi:AsmA-like C-terminal region-containing protein [Jannaschia sp. S6380]|uniref:AsmA-like C-terminal region-containing protein n=1 Tax=Jannaschia sp. S6380 TaxID=2926408 RepID=UPI001FF6464E|nr:AsmA-like C-terminal region-containing protein [Jannaschia sp. S6380]MCK0167069.1 AsmA-like C-terminal region-containing protein [Jannaschia sp. S6380]